MSQEGGEALPSAGPLCPLGECLLKGWAKPPTLGNSGQTPFWLDIRFHCGDEDACKVTHGNRFPSPFRRGWPGLAGARASLPASGRAGGPRPLTPPSLRHHL